jgi:hypothetical protein
MLKQLCNCELQLQFAHDVQKEFYLGIRGSYKNYDLEIARFNSNWPLARQ